MGRYNKILIAVDGSQVSKNVLRQAFKLAPPEKKCITVVAINPPYEGDILFIGVGNISELLKAPGEKILSEAKEIARSEGVTIETRLEEGEIFEEIINVAEEERCDLIVMGRHGMTRLERALMGSVTAKVIGHFKGRILIIPTKDTSIGWKNILVATDGSKYSDAAVDEAINYAKSYEGTLKIVTAVDVTEKFQVQAPELLEESMDNAKKNLDDIKNKAQQAGVNLETFVREGEPYKVIADLATESNADIIVMGSHGRTGLKRLLMGSVSEKVIGYAPCPVLVVR